MTTDEAIHKLEYSKKAYQTLIDEKVDSGKIVGDGVRGEWKAETSLDEAYKSMIEALDIAIKVLEQVRWISISERLPEDGTWNLWTDGKKTSFERYKLDAIDHFFPQGRWFDFDDAIAWMPLPQPYTESEE